MQEDESGRDILNGIIDREIEKHPHNQALIEAFRPVIVSRNQILETLAWEEGVALPFDEARFRGGIPVMVQAVSLPGDSPWTAAARALIPAVRAGFPALDHDLARLAEALESGKISISDYMQAGLADQKEIMAGWSQTLSIAAAAIAFVLDQTSRIIFEKWARSMGERIKDIPWKKGYCPVCGAFPTLAVIKEKIGERLLHCSSCGHDWRFSRVICPYCDYEAPEGMNFFFVEGKEQESVYTCDQCHRYLVTLSRISDLNDRDLDVCALGLVHLDVVMQDKQLLPMAATSWNDFGENVRD